MRITKHFRDRLIERFGLVLLDDIENAILECSKSQLELHPPIEDEKNINFDMVIQGCKLVAVYNVKNETFLTCYSGNRSGGKKIQKLFNPDKKHKQRMRDGKRRDARLRQK